MIEAQLVGLVGVAILFAMFQFNKRETILWLMMAAGAVWAAHFFLLGAYTAAIMNILVGIRAYVFDRYRHKAYLQWVMLVVVLIAGVLTWSNWTSTLPLIASVIANFALWEKNPRRIRMMMLMVPPLWFTHNIFNASYAGMLGDAVVFTSLLIAIFRFDIRKQTLQPEAVPVKVKR